MSVPEHMLNPDPENICEMCEGMSWKECCDLYGQDSVRLCGQHERQVQGDEAERCFDSIMER